MPNEITTPKVLKETIKQVYESMKADNLLLEFDRRTVLRLIIEALSAEDIQAMTGAKDDKARNKLYRKLAKKYHPDKNPDNKEQAQQDFQDLTNLNKDPSIADTLLKKAGTTGEPSGNQQAQGDQKDVSPEVVQNVGEFLKKTQEKYHKLYEQMQQVIKKFTEEPAAFFADEQFVNNLVSIAQALNEQKGEGLGVELKDGDLKGNIQRIIAGLEKIRKELLQALSRKATLSKQRPEKEEGGEQQKQLNENKELYEKAKALLKREKSFYDEVNKAVESYVKDDSDENIKKILTSFRKRKRFADFKENFEKVQDLMQAVEEQRKGAQTVINKFRAGKGLTSDGFKKDIEAVGNYTQAYETLQQAIPSEKQDSKPMPLVPTVIDKVDDKQPLTIIDKSGKDVLEITKQEADATYDIITAADKFVRIYELLFALIQKKISLDKLPLPKKIDLSKPPQQPRIDLTKVPFVKISLAKPELTGDSGAGVVTDTKPEIKSDAFAIGKTDFKKWYYEDSKKLQENKDENTIKDSRSMYKAFLDFKNDFTTIPMLKIQVAIFTQIYEKIKWLSDADNLKIIGGGSKTAGRTKSQPEPEQKQPEKTVTEAEGDSNQVEFDENDIQVFKDEYGKLLKLSRIINKLVGKLTKAEDLDTMGGQEIVKQTRTVADLLQDSLSRLHDTMSQELSDFIGKGGRLNEQEPDSDTNLEREQDFEAQMQSDADEIFGVHESVVGYLTTIDKAVREEKTEQINSNKILPFVKKSLEELNSIKKHFPSISPFGKETDDPRGMIEDMKIFLEGIVTDVEDLMQQLKGITTAEKKALKEATEKRYTSDKDTVNLFLEKIVEVAQQVQDYFDAPSRIGKVAALRAKKVTNMDNAAALNQAGIKAVEQGKAEAPEAQEKEDEQETKGLTTHSQTVTRLKSYENVLKDIYSDLSDQPGKIKEIQAIGGKAFTRALVVLLNKFPEAEKQVQEELGAKLSTPEGAGFKVFGMTKEKVKIINDLIKIDKTGKLSLFMYALRKDKVGATVLKKKVDQKLKGFSFNLDFNEVKKFFTTNKEKEQEVKQEQLEKKLEKLIEHYMTHGI